MRWSWGEAFHLHRCCVGPLDLHQAKSGKSYPADVVILALGVRPDTTLAKMAGLAVCQRGGILLQNGFKARNLAGNMLSRSQVEELRDK